MFIFIFYKFCVGLKHSFSSRALILAHHCNDGVYITYLNRNVVTESDCILSSTSLSIYACSVTCTRHSQRKPNPSQSS